MQESEALAVLAVRAIETQDPERRLWPEEDRAWATRAAASVVGQAAPIDRFLARRADLALERLGPRQRGLQAQIAQLRWRPWLAWLPVLLALAAGFAIDRLGSTPRFDLLAPPVLGLIAWNLVAYVVLLASLLSPNRRPLRHWLTGWLGLLPVAAPASTGASPGDPAALRARALATLHNDWARLAKPLYAARVARILHLSALAFALGVLAGLYLRGLGVEYRATWESTFLDADQVHALLGVLLAPGLWLTGLPLPDAAHLAGIRHPADENAGPWLHLYAASLSLLVLLPRLLLALLASLLEARRSAHFKLPIEEAYFARLLRGFTGAHMRFRVLPFSLTLTDTERTGLERIIDRVWGGGAVVTFEASLGWEEADARLATLPAGTPETRLVVFSLSATPEAEVQGQFLRALRGQGGAGSQTLALIDETGWRQRWPDDTARTEARRRLWQDFLGAHQIPGAITTLAQPDPEAIQHALDATPSSPTQEPGP